MSFNYHCNVRLLIPYAFLKQGELFETFSVMVRQGGFSSTILYSHQGIMKWVRARVPSTHTPTISLATTKLSEKWLS